MALNDTMGDRLWSKIDAEGDCWEWQRARDPRGYGRFQIDGGSRLAHRIVWEALVGPIPSGLELDHLCRNPSCVNPDHLEPVTHKENLRRGYGAPQQFRNKTHCKRGHPLSGDNLQIHHGSRVCRTCNIDRARVWNLQRKDPHAS